MQETLTIILSIHVVLLGYTWLGYHLLLSLFAKTRQNRQKAISGTSYNPATKPNISIIIAAYNEENVIAERIKNLQNIDYPKEKTTVYIGCDGCTDATVAEALKAADGDSHFQIIDYKNNRGKVSILRDLVAKANETQKSTGTNDLLIFSDANTMFAPNAINKLIPHFADKNIGGVCGRLAFVNKETDSENPAQEGAYWKLETKLKTWESKLDSCLGANGAIYAIRPELFWSEIPENTIVDDFVIGMKVREQGFRMVYEPEAVATEVIPEVSDEWVRRVRIGAGDYQAAILCKKTLHPRFGCFAWAFWSHKIMRWFTPHMAITTTITSYILTAISLLNRDFTSLPAIFAYLSAAGMSALFVTGHIGSMLRKYPGKNLITKICAVSEHFVTMHAALFVGFIRFCRGNMSGTWKRTPRNE